jgi:hypothetical protein
MVGWSSIMVKNKKEYGFSSTLIPDRLIPTHPTKLTHNHWLEMKIK